MYLILFVVLRLVAKKNIIIAILNLIVYTAATFAFVSVFSIVLFHVMWLTILLIVIMACLAIYIILNIIGQLLSPGADTVILDNGEKLKKKKGVFQDGSNYREDSFFGSEYKTKDGKNFRKK